jgi:hypothetical protein
LNHIKEKDIKNAGDWLESVYSLAIDSGAERELITRLIAALSVNKDESVEDYLNRIAEHAGENLKKAIESFDLSEIDARNPEELIDFLISNADKYGYTTQEVFETFAKLINSDKKTAEEIVQYIEDAEAGNMWLIWLIILGGGTLIFFIIWRRRRKKEEE